MNWTQHVQQATVKLGRMAMYRTSTIHAHTYNGNEMPCKLTQKALKLPEITHISGQKSKDIHAITVIILPPNGPKWDEVNSHSDRAVIGEDFGHNRLRS